MAGGKGMVRSVMGRLLPGAVALVWLAAMAPGTAAAGSLTTLYTFCSQANCADGATPEGGLGMDAAGNLYGVTAFGGNPSGVGKGALFELTTGGEETVLHGFCTTGVCFDGTEPLAGPIVDKSGIIFGTAAFGANTGGVVYTQGSGGFGVIYAFCLSPGCPDGENPNGRLAFGKRDKLFGTTMAGGANKAGTVF
jgi:uncharacterized repeat protein (TIGR03803 family)